MCTRLLISAVLAVGAVVPATAAAAGDGGGPPRTLARTVAVGAAPVVPGVRVDQLGVQWRGAPRGHGRVRFRHGTRWGAWRPLHPGELHPPGRAATELIAGRGATAYQVRAPRGARRVRAVAINTSDGPRRPAATPAQDRGGAGPPRLLGLGRPCLRLRAGWGADEQLRFDAAGTEVWPPAFFAVQRLTVHHTATDTGVGGGAGDDPAALVRAIYRYHAVDLGWGDIAYHLLIDQRGCIYEGRHSGADGTPVYARAPGSGGPPDAVNAGHTGGFNAGNLGVALIGNYNDADPSRAAMRALTRTLAALAGVSGLDPRGAGPYVNPISGATRDTPVISGHRDWLATECPGERLYAQLPALREAVAEQLAFGAAG